MSLRVVGFIPARLQSTRLPRKLLLAETGRPLIEHTWQSARKARSLAELVIATDSAEIADVVRKFGGRCELTGEHPNGTDRIAEVVRRSFRDADVIVNVQGDEPEIDPAQIDLMVEALVANPAAQMSTLATPITTREVRDSPSCVKVVCAADGRALYFSRSVIPHVRDDPDSFFPEHETAPKAATASPPLQGGARGGRLTDHYVQRSAGSGLEPKEQSSPWLLHLGLYAYRREFLLKLTELPPSRLEQLEKLEQLRALEAGATIQVAVVPHPAVGIDTPEDYARFVKRVQEGRTH